MAPLGVLVCGIFWKQTNPLDILATPKMSWKVPQSFHTSLPLFWHSSEMRAQCQTRPQASDRGRAEGSPVSLAVEF